MSKLDFFFLIDEGWSLGFGSNPKRIIAHSFRSKGFGATTTESLGQSQGFGLNVGNGFGFSWGYGFGDHDGSGGSNLENKHFLADERIDNEKKRDSDRG